MQEERENEKEENPGRVGRPKRKVKRNFTVSFISFSVCCHFSLFHCPMNTLTTSGKGSGSRANIADRSSRKSPPEDGMNQ
jgi:hypothetical protein